jgi:hypothetical protein
LVILQSKFKYSLLKTIFGVDSLKEENEKIILPKELQKQMMKFFLTTSIPRIKAEKEKNRLLSENQETDRSEE